MGMKQGDATGLSLELIRLQGKMGVLEAEKQNLSDKCDKLRDNNKLLWGTIFALVGVFISVAWFLLSNGLWPKILGPIVAP